MGAMGRPLRPAPGDFEEVFVALGWDSVDIDPDDSADKMAAMMIELVSLRTEVAAYRNHQVAL